MNIRFLSVCSGIEAASTAWKPLGWTPVAFSEIEPFPSSVLASHYPHVPNWGDMTKFEGWPDEPIDLLCGGTPCQSFSVAGLRKGLADPRGNLMLTFGAIAAKYRPRWLVWENVPGVLSSNGGRDFGSFLGLLAELGYGFAYRVLDAQYVRVQSHPRAVPQRRRRVFVVGHSGGLWQRAAAVLFERESLRGHPAPRREARQVAPTIPARSTAGGGLGTDFDCDGGTICVATGQAGAEIGADMAPTLNCNHGWGIQEEATHTLDRGMGVAAVAIHENQRAEITLNDTAGALNSGGGKPGQGYAAVMAFQPGNISRGAGSSPNEEVFPTLKADHGRSFSDQSPHVATAMQVRRLTPVECERLQGFPDNYTAIPWRKKPASECPDGPRYKALGNSWAINCARWVGERIDAVDRIVG